MNINTVLFKISAQLLIKLQWKKHSTEIKIYQLW